ncbi:MAG: arginase family protein [Candidatus Aenigmatarchaeota archaeon]
MDFEMIGILLDRKIFGRGSHNAPLEIRRIFPRMETFINGIDLEEHGLVDVGNILPKNYDKMIIEAKVRIDGKFPVIIGGDHSISYVGVKTVKPKVFVSFDAHPDCEPGELKFDSVTRKIAEEGFKTVLYGVRSSSKKETEFIKAKKIKIASLEDMKKINEPTYLSIDFDVLDSSIMPAVSNPEPDGLTFKEVMDGVRALAKNLVAIDFVEFVPTKNTTHTLMAGKLIYHSLAEIVKAKLQ